MAGAYNNLAILEERLELRVAAETHYRTGDRAEGSVPRCAFQPGDAPASPRAVPARDSRECEWRWQTSRFTPFRVPHPLWDGRRLDGTLLVHSEQGAGDAMQFVRYLPIAAERCDRLIFFCPENLFSPVSIASGRGRIARAGDGPGLRVPRLPPADEPAARAGYDPGDRPDPGPLPASGPPIDRPRAAADREPATESRARLVRQPDASQRSASIVPPARSRTATRMSPMWRSTACRSVPQAGEVREPGRPDRHRGRPERPPGRLRRYGRGDRAAGFDDQRGYVRPPPGRCSGPASLGNDLGPERLAMADRSRGQPVVSDHPAVPPVPTRRLVRGVRARRPNSRGGLHRTGLAISGSAPRISKDSESSTQTEDGMQFRLTEARSR